LGQLGPPCNIKLPRLVLLSSVYNRGGALPAGQVIICICCSCKRPRSQHSVL